MHLSIFDLFKIGLGPSSSHTVGPMKAACLFVNQLQKAKKLTKTQSVKVELYGSLALTGLGHRSDTAILLGLEGEDPGKINPAYIPQRLNSIREKNCLSLAGIKEISFQEKKDLVLKTRDRLPFHTNGMQFFAYDEQGHLLQQDIYYSIGGGFVLHEKETRKNTEAHTQTDHDIPYPFSSGETLLKLGKEHQLSIAEIMMENEKCFKNETEIKSSIRHIWQVMQDCIEQGLKTEGILPGGLSVQRRAPVILKKLKKKPIKKLDSSLIMMDWVNLWAMAVNEENAAGGRVVTAPTNGAAGIIPSVLKYYTETKPKKVTPEEIETFLLTAGAIGSLYKKNASISGAEAGCQGEVGVACSMAAAALAALMGGNNDQIENAAEIGMEHNLGLTCDPIGGLVQIPCIERNAMASVKAIDAARLALYNDGNQKVSLDEVIKTMHQTGLDMAEKYKETSKGGLAVNVTIIEC